MSVALMPSAYAPNIGGVEEVTRAVARTLHRRGEPVTIVAPRWPSSLPATDCIDGIDVRRLQFTLPSRRLGQFARDFQRSMVPLLRHFRQCRVEVIHLHCLGPNTLYALAASKWLRLPLVVTTHGEIQGDDTSLRQVRLMAGLRRLAFQHAAWVTAPSDFTLRHIPSSLRCPASVVPNGVDHTAPEGGAGEQPYIFCAARFSYSKGIDLGLRAFAAAAPEMPGVELRIAGDGDDRPQLQELARTLGVDRRVRFLGAKTRAEVLELMSQSLFFLCPSRNESFGLASLEAMSQGKPVVATRVGGVPEVVVDGVTGLLVPGEDPQALAQGLVRLANMGDLRHRMGAAARNRASGFTWDGVVQQYLDGYRSACHR